MILFFVLGVFVMPVPTGAEVLPGAGNIGIGRSIASMQSRFTSTKVAKLEYPHVYPGGGMFGFGDAMLTSPEMPEPLNAPIIGGIATHSGEGFWLVGADGGVYAFGDAPFEGSAGSLHLQAPIVGIANTPNDRGYWLVGLDGGVFSYGDAQFYGSMGGTALNQPVVGMAATPDGKGYWLVSADGGIFTFGDAHFYGSLGGQTLTAQVVGMMSSSNGQGYTLATAAGEIYTFGNATNYGQLYTGGPATPVSAIIPGYEAGGYWLLDPDAWTYSFLNPPPNYTFAGAQAIVAAASSQVRPDPFSGYFCNPYGPCEEWCALFATWAWEQGGWAIPSYAFTGDIYYWSQEFGTILAPSATPAPGDAVLYGTGPQTTQTSLHVGIVAQVWPDGALVTVEGDAGPGATGALAVVINGPYLPSDSSSYNGFGIYAYAQP